MSVASKRIEGIVARHLGPDADDDLFAKAMTHICDGYPPSCSLAHDCLQDGDCFRRRPDIMAARALEKFADSQDGTVRSYVLAAARAIRHGQIYVGGEVLDLPL